MGGEFMRLKEVSSDNIFRKPVERRAFFAPQCPELTPF